MPRFASRVLGFALAFGIVFQSAHPAQAWGHHGCHLFRHGFSPAWGAYGMGGGFRSLGYGYCNTAFYASSCLPFYACYAPVVYPTYYCPPVYYPSVWISPIVYSRPSAAPGLSRLSLASVRVSKPAAAAAPASWLASAVDLIDLMVRQGGVDEGLQACEHLMRVRDDLPGEIYWRAAMLASLSGREAHQIVAFIERAEKSKVPFSGQQLPGGSFRAYAQSANGTSVDEALDRLAKAALSKADPNAEYRALSGLLTLDDQPARARIFLAAANKPAFASIASTNRTTPLQPR